jgi:hypothetical protein
LVASLNVADQLSSTTESKLCYDTPSGFVKYERAYKTTNVALVPTFCSRRYPAISSYATLPSLASSGTNFSVMERPPSEYHAPPKFVPASADGLKSFKEHVVNEPDTVFSDNLNPFRSSSRSLEQLLVEDNDPLYGDSEDLRRQREVMRQPAFQQRRDQLVRELNSLWSRSSPKYNKVRARLYDEWYQCFQSELRNRFDKFLSLLGQSETRGVRDSLQDRFDWIDHVENELKEIRCPSEEYFDWVGKIHDWIVELVEEPQIFGSTTGRSKFEAILEKADWRMANDDSAIVNAMLLYGSDEDHPDLTLTLRCDFESFGLQLRLNGRALAIRDTDLSTLELYGARALNPKIISGLRFDSVDLPLGGHGVEKATEKKSLIVVMLGEYYYVRCQRSPLLRITISIIRPLQRVWACIWPKVQVQLLTRSKSR